METNFDSKIISLIEKNLEYYLNIFASLPGGSINREPDLTWIITDFPSKYVNILYGANFQNKGLIQRIEVALEPYRKRGNPVHWYVGPRTRPSHLPQVLVECGFSLSCELTGMFAYPHAVLQHVFSSALTITEAEDYNGLLDFAKVFIAANGYNRESSPALAALWANTGIGPGNEWRYVIGWYEQKPAATATIRIDHESGTILHVAVLPEFRKRGFGTFMTHAALKFLHPNGNHLTILHATEKARSLYANMGFKPVCKLIAYTWSG